MHHDVAPVERDYRFRRVLLSCVFGDPADATSWSGAPYNLGHALRRLGVTVYGICPRISRIEKVACAVSHLLHGYGRLTSGEQILRGRPARRTHAARIAAEAARLGIADILHFGTLDMPAAERSGAVRHYVYCDHTWALSLTYRTDLANYTADALNEFDVLEREAFADVEHIFTFGAYVRDNLIDHYGLSPRQVTAVGSGMGSIEAYAGPKDYSKPNLLFVAKHLFEAKGGLLLLEAFGLALARRPDLTLTIVGDERSRRFVPSHPQITLHARLPWDALQRLYREATLLVQPMLNDPWGQVYLEALASRTPVLGLRRNGLPEIVQDQRHGFLVEAASAPLLAEAILDALADPDRLARLGENGQRHVLGTYSWDRVAEQIALH